MPSPQLTPPGAGAVGGRPSDAYSTPLDAPAGFTGSAPLIGTGLQLTPADGIVMNLAGAAVAAGVVVTAPIALAAASDAALYGGVAAVRLTWTYPVTAAIIAGGYILVAGDAGDYAAMAKAAGVEATTVAAIKAAGLVRGFSKSPATGTPSTNSSPIQSQTVDMNTEENDIDN